MQEAATLQGSKAFSDGKIIEGVLYEYMISVGATAPGYVVDWGRSGPCGKEGRVWKY